MTPTDPWRPYGTLAYRDSFQTIPEVEELQRNKPAWITAGKISFRDIRFLANMILDHRPPAMLEIGTASGFSAAVMLAAFSKLAEEGVPLEETWVHSFDISDRYYANADYPIGAAVGDLLPALAHRARFYGGKRALDTRSTFPKNHFSMAFIDACHHHPWPALDLMAILPVMKPGSWVLLHDVFLPYSDNEEVTGQFYGAHLLFTMWGGPKILMRDEVFYRNIGAIQLSADRQRDHACLAQLLQLQWETKIDDLDYARSCLVNAE